MADLVPPHAPSLDMRGFRIFQGLIARPAQERMVEEVAERKRDEGLPQVDNPWRQPGEFVVDEDGVLRLTYRYQYCRDFPDPRVLLTAIRESKR